MEVSRSGRVRKPKSFFDPSDDPTKRRSLPIVETKKLKKSTDEPTSPKREKTAAAEPKLENVQTKMLSPSEIMANPITKRRQTVGPVVFENACIVCSRSDPKKGRFVNCTNCMKRGHFTCLRTGKLFKTADIEKDWQCSSCKICEVCEKQEPLVSFSPFASLCNMQSESNFILFFFSQFCQELLYKCVSCYNSYHPQCIDLNPKSIIKKRFSCVLCTRMESKELEAKENVEIKTEPKVEVATKSNDGFAGFTQDEQSSKRNSGQKQTSSKAKKPRLLSNNSSNSDEQSNDETIETKKKNEPKFKPSKSDEETNADDERKRKSSDGSSFSRCNSDQKISVRTDLLEGRVEYNTKTAITPHESVPDVKKWTCDEVFTYFMGTTTAEFADQLKENQIDGDALLLLRREDVLNRFNLKLGPALHLYSQIVSLQYKNNNPILAWNEF